MNADELNRPPAHSATRWRPRTVYEDKAFDCSVCGRRDFWTAAQQQFWYEVVKAHVWAAPTLR